MEQFISSEGREKNKEIISRLTSYLNQGYVLHGSKSSSPILEPRQAHDVNPDRVLGKAYALYAEGTDIRIPIFMALKAPKIADAYGGYTSGYSGHGPDQPLRISGKNLAFTTGFVHVLPRDSFEIEEHGDDTELMSRVPVEAIEIIRVEPSILEELPYVEIDIED
jgi:hypothetical protein